VVSFCGLGFLTVFVHFIPVVYDADVVLHIALLLFDVDCCSGQLWEKFIAE